MCVLQHCFTELEPQKHKPQGSRNNAANTDVYLCRSTSTEPPFPLTLFIHGFILRTFGFIVCGGSSLRPFMSNGKERWKKKKIKLTKWAIASYRPGFSLPPSIAELFHHRTCPRSLRSSWPEQLSLLTRRLESQLVVSQQLLLTQQNNTQALPLAGGKACYTRCQATVWKRQPNTFGQVVLSRQVEQAG